MIDRQWCLVEVQQGGSRQETQQRRGFAAIPGVKPGNEVD